ncbi:MAG: hypothetical protein LQ342_006625 [Letrouitia transgressa]|nr:MAG: hypothetical protein LQ342_006625 [Letrouitia transgressa]
MDPPAPSNPEPEDPSSDLAQAFRDLAKGEHTASVMERQLTALERKIDGLLAAAESQAEPAGNTKAETANRASATPLSAPK